ncbi:cyclodeaminase/cyclohydrolase family protein [Paenibacillus radicis (ex Gao et al. 2016)]|uniref:Sugar ABC transporter substrate-binding protein n=1 Tax=Paenibacillus radicis (ex Gao et al. 2016) TaxID=1737354 RepID=A0A917HHA4_9BACL|nr:cyclodeaminase/cyclohydrolase family protein [Paenibacillus radicis (ex Gao et al. 2016)]GGG79243.1 sugar ABC transporter substrate-binding protein [Paenibacillus radicis (ex Gao et al. 2016)]
MTPINWDYSIRDFVQQSSSSSPTPGGGSVAALAAALGAAMTSMVCNLTQGEKYADFQPLVTDALAKMQHFTGQCEALLAADIASFDTYMHAVKLPAGTDEEKTLRKQAIQLAAIRAIDVPLELMKACKNGLESTESIANAANKNVISDLGIGAIMMKAAAESALLTVQINLNSLKDAELSSQYSDKANRLMEAISTLHVQTLKTVQTRIAIN